MTVEYRMLRSEEARDRSYAGRLGFGDSTADADIDRALERTRLTPDMYMAAIDDGAIASQVAVYPMTMRWNGRDIGCAGVTAVSTLPTHRRRGYLRELMTRWFAKMREEDQPVAMLWASMAAIYQRFGYGICYTRLRGDFDPRHLRFVDAMAIPGRTRMVKSSEARPVVAGVYERYAAPRTLMLERDELTWERTYLSPWDPKAPPYLVVVYEEEGEALGYATYEIKQHQRNVPGPDQEVRLWDFAWTTPAAHRALISHIVGYDLAFSVHMDMMPVDDPLFHHVQEPRLLGLSAVDGTLVRIVDVVAALEGRGYDCDGRVRFGIEDDMCPWNTGTWELTVEGGSARVKPAGAAADVCLTPRALAMLASGYQSATTLVRIGLIPSADASALRSADDLFRTACAPLCADHF
jgi:predicted acetyltransferase